VPALEGISAYPGGGGYGAGSGGAGSALVAWTDAGTAVYLPDPRVEDEVPIHWMDRTGSVTALRATPAIWANPAFSPDGRRLALDINTGQTALYLYDWPRDTLTRLAPDARLAIDNRPVWTPDGRRIAFRSARDTRSFNLYWRRANGSGDVERLTESPDPQIPASWHPSGKFLAFTESRPATGVDLMILPMDGDEASGWRPRKPWVFLSTQAAELEPMFSPDGRWIAYYSNESGRFDVYVRPFPGPGGRYTISTDGGSYPVWSQARHEIVYQTPENRLMVASYRIEGDAFIADKPRVWSDHPFRVRPGFRSFDLHPDGDRVVLATAPEGESGVKPGKLVFIFNFFDELHRIAPRATR
jgi:serine/threonine-protein kinase